MQHVIQPCQTVTSLDPLKFLGPRHLVVVASIWYTRRRVWVVRLTSAIVNDWWLIAVSFAPPR
jgi:hypothetical protein